MRVFEISNFHEIREIYVDKKKDLPFVCVNTLPETRETPQFIIFPVSRLFLVVIHSAPLVFYIPCVTTFFTRLEVNFSFRIYVASRLALPRELISTTRT